MNLDSPFQNLLTSGINPSDPVTLRKFKVANSFQLAFIMAAPFLGLLYFYIGALPLFYVAIGAGLLMIASLILLRVTKSLALGGHFAIFVIWLSLLFISWHTGAVSYEGVLGPTFILKAGLILLAIFLLGYPGGTLWTTIVFLESGLIVYLYRSGFQFPNLIPPEIAAVYALGSYLVGLLCILLFAFLFEKEKGEVLLQDRRKADALRESNRYIEDILRNSPVPTFILDRNHRVVHWNAACTELTGVNADEVLGKRTWEGFCVDPRGSVADLILSDPGILENDYRDRIISANDHGWFELRLRFPKIKEGVQAVVTASPIVEDEGVVRGAIQTITLSPDPDREKGDREGMQCRFDEANGPPAFRVDAQGKITYWSEACEREYRYPSSEMLGKNIFALVSKDYRPLFKETIEGALEGKSYTGRPFKYVLQEGRAVYVLAEAYPAAGSQEDPGECVIVNTDITELRMKMKRLKLYAAETREKLKSLTEEHELLKRNIASFIRKKEDPH